MKILNYLKIIVLIFSSLSAHLLIQNEAFAENSFISSSKNALGSLLTNDNSNDILDADEAFKLNLNSYENNLIIQWMVTDQYYLYRNRMKVFIDDQELPISLPPGEEKEDPLFGQVQVYYHSVETQIPFSQIENVKGKTLRVVYQGCAEIGVCYPPQQKTFQMSELSKLLMSTAHADEAAPSAPPKAQSNNDISEVDQITAQLANSALWLTILGFFIAGLLLSFTPCVFPLIPILSGILSQQAEKLNSRSGLKVSVIYVLSMSFTYAVIGVLAALLGKNLQATLQQPWLLGSFSLVFVMLALSMFGFFQLQLPLSWQNSLNNLLNKKDSSSTLNVIIMGLLSALIVGPCVTPPLAGALIYIGQSGDVLTGGLSLFAMSIGMGTPLVMMGTFAGHLLPKAGAWMDTVKSVFGVFMLALAIYFLDRFIPVWLSMLLWSTLLIISAVYMRAFEGIDAEKTKWQYLFRGIAWILLILGIILLLGLASGGRSLLQPLKHISANQQIQTTTQQINGQSFFQKAQSGQDIRYKLAQAKKANRPVMFYMTADWCISCKELEAFTFSDDEVIQAMQNQLAYKIDVTDNTENDEQLMQSMQIIGPPTIVFFNSSGEEIKSYRVVGLISAKDFKQRIESWKQS